eukprot:SAG22_NODE_2167_length_2905_cov_1.403778_2_plen_96_part_00
MNLVLDNASEISVKKKTEKPLGRILLKGDNITLMMQLCVLERLPNDVRLPARPPRPPAGPMRLAARQPVCLAPPSPTHPRRVSPLPQAFIVCAEI